MGFWDFDDEQEDTVKTRANIGNLFSYATNPIGAIARDLQDDKLNPLDAAATNYSVGKMNENIIKSNPEYGYGPTGYRRIANRDELADKLGDYRTTNTMHALFGQPFEKESIFDVSRNPVNKLERGTQGATLEIYPELLSSINPAIPKLFNIPSKEDPFNLVFLGDSDNDIKDMAVDVHEWRHTEQPKDTKIYPPDKHSADMPEDAKQYYGLGREIDARLEQLDALNNSYKVDSNNKQTQKLIIKTLKELMPFMESYSAEHPNDNRIDIFNSWTKFGDD